MISPRETFDQNYQRHLNHLHLKGYRPKTVDAYARAIRRVRKLGMAAVYNPRKTLRNRPNRELRGEFSSRDQNSKELRSFAALNNQKIFSTPILTFSRSGLVQQPVEIVARSAITI